MSAAPDPKKTFPRMAVVPTKNDPIVCVLTIETSHTADGAHVYKVVGVKNSLDYEPGEVLSDDEMAALVADPNWDIFTTQPRLRADVQGG
jgi:hypothetical protein